MKLNEEQKFELVYRFYKDLYDSDLSLVEIGDELFDFMISLYTERKFPRIMSDKKYSALPCIEYYRGAARLESHARYLVDYNFHPGQGNCMNGKYASEKYKEAYDYTEVMQKGGLVKSRKRVLKFKVPYARIIDYDTLEAITDYVGNKLGISDKESITEYKREKLKHLSGTCRAKIRNFVEFMKGLNRKDLEGLYGQLDVDIGKMGTILGYDAVKLDDNLIVLNREKITVSKSEFNRITKGSCSYKKGVVNHKSIRKQEISKNI